MAKKQQLGLLVVENEPLHEKVYREIVRALVSGEFEPGQKLTSRKLAQELGTSDMPVRAALMRLQALQALKSLPNGSLEVPQMTASTFTQLTDARLVVEGAATERAAVHVNGNNLRTIRRLSEELTAAAKAGDIQKYLAANYNFKFSIYHHCGNAPLLFLIETLWMQIGPFLRHFGDSLNGKLADILEMDYHEDALEALVQGDAARARDAIIRDIREGAVLLLDRAAFAPE